MRAPATLISGLPMTLTVRTVEQRILRLRGQISILTDKEDWVAILDVVNEIIDLERDLSFRERQARRLALRPAIPRCDD